MTENITITKKPRPIKNGSIKAKRTPTEIVVSVRESLRASSNGAPVPRAPRFHEYGNPDELNLMLPAGLGDVYWVLAKFYRWLDQSRTVYWIPAGEQHRTGGLLQMLGLRYGYMPGLKTTWVWDQPTRNLPEKGWVPVQCNRHLENGNHLAQWFPDAELHYPNLRDKVFYEPICRQPKVLGFMCHRNYMGGQLSVHDWAEMFRTIDDEVAPVKIVAAGHDVEFAEEVRKYYHSPFSPMYNHPFQEVFGEIAESKMMIGVASGLTIISTCAGIPTLMAYPRWLEKMPGTWEPEGCRAKWCFIDEALNVVQNLHLPKLS